MGGARSLSLMNDGETRAWRHLLGPRGPGLLADSLHPTPPTEPRATLLLPHPQTQLSGAARWSRFPSRLFLPSRKSHKCRRTLEGGRGLARRAP